MKLALSLGGDAPKRLPDSIEKHRKMVANKNLEFCMGLGPVTNERRERENHGVEGKEEEEKEARVSSDPPLQLDLLPLSPFPRTQTSNNSLLTRLPWITDNSATAEPGSSDNGPQKGEEQSSPNSAVSSFPMEFSSIYRARGGTRKRDLLERNEIVEEETERASSNDDDSNGLTRKKLRLSKQQSAFLEDSFKEHHSLNPKQKLALAKQLNLRPRQVEVWFQNRRARTKLKQTEVDCEYLRRRCETLREENRRMQRELQELRALKTCQPFYMHPQQHLPATTLSMCPSCERVATTTVTSATTAGNPISTTVTGGSSLDAATSLCIANRPTFYPFSDASHNRPASPSMMRGGGREALLSKLACA